MKCEKCNNNHSGSFGSGRFCSRTCSSARTFSKKSLIKKSEATKSWLARETNSNRKKRIEKYKQSMKRNRISKLEQLDFDSLSDSLKRKKILQEQNFQCNLCSIGTTWNEQPLKLELDHINGDKKNNSRTNLRMICPNCHQQTPTYKGKNRQNNKNVGIKYGTFL